MPYNSRVRRRFNAVFLGIFRFLLMSARLTSGFSSVKQERIRIALETDFTSQVGVSSKSSNSSKGITCQSELLNGV